jgi:GNAT superfamily N-acetyltransferase/predicted nucleic acid-binding protein
MVIIDTIDDNSPHLEAVKKLWGLHRGTLGFLPAGAFDQHARDRHIIVALNGADCVGYILYRTPRQRVAITHFCVAEHARKKGVARAMLDRLIKTTKHCRGIVLSCRRDYEAASKAWPRLGFHAASERPGRAAVASELVRWELDYNQPDLFSNIDEPASLEAAIDSNVFLDLVEHRSDETEGLRADWLRPLLKLCYTRELLNDVNQHQSADTRKKRRADAQQFKLLQCTPEEYQKAEQALKPLFPNLSKVRDESDFRHLVRAVACEADAFITRDRSLLDRADEVFNVCGLPVERPVELIGRIDIIEHERDYQRNFVAGTRQIVRERVSCADAELIMAIQAKDEKQNMLAASLNTYLADPQCAQCHKFSEVDGTILAAFVIERKSGIDRVPILRICAKRQGRTLARSILTSIVRQAVQDGSNAVLVSETALSDTVHEACADLGFIPIVSGRLKLVLSGWSSITETAARLTWADPKIDELKSALPSARTDPIAASQIEHILWPAKLIDAALPCFIVPIRPQFAEHLFDERLASGSLFGADVDLALNTESAYYRAAKPAIVSCPARVLWYVSENAKYAGSKAIRACSRLVEVATDTPKELYKRFRRLGVYEWAHVRETANGDVNKKIMAFRFDDSELLQPVPWDDFQKILRSHSISTTLQSPVKITTLAFHEIHAASLNPSEARRRDLVGNKTS